MARAPTPEQKAQENAVLFTALADLAVLAIQIVFAILTRSLTLLSEAVRVGLMLTIELYTYFILRAVHRDRLGKFRFGIGQLEQMCNCVIGVCLVLSGLWVAHQVFKLLVFGEAAATPLGLAIAAVINAMNLAINSLGWFAMVSAARSDGSAIFKAQLKARTVKLLSSVVVQTTMTIAALAKDPLIAAWLDGLGASFIATLIISIGCRMIWDSLPGLLDRSVREELSTTIDSILDEASVGSIEIARRRTRCAGGISHIEFSLIITKSVSVKDFLDRARDLESRLRGRLPDADFTIGVHEVGGSGPDSDREGWLPVESRTIAAGTIIRSVDFGLPLLLGVVGLMSNMLSLISLSFAGLMLAGRDALLLAFRRGLIGGPPKYFQYGLGKALRAGDLFVALCALSVGIWLADEALEVMVLGTGAISPLGLALGTTTNALVAIWHGILTFGPVAPFDAAMQEVPSRRRRLLFALLVAIQLFLTIACLTEDLAIAHWVDTLGALAVSLILVGAGSKLAWDCVRDLIDYPLDKDWEATLTALTLHNGIQPGELVDLRTRQCGQRVFVQMTLSLLTPTPIEEVRQLLANLRRALETAVTHLDLVIKLRGNKP